MGCGMAAQTSAEPVIKGDAYVIDGDSLKLSGTEIRLFGVDAFEYKQNCGRFACGRVAARTLQDLVKSGPVSCQPKDHDKYGRTVAQCFDKDGHDLGKIMVQKGLAVAYRHFSPAYIADEEAAHQKKTGAWAYPFISPYDYRRKEKAK